MSTVVTVGSFDGVHRGHQAVLAELVAQARVRGLVSVAIALDPHPLEIVNPPAAPRLLTLREEKAELLRATGVDRIEFLAFTPELARLAPEEFTRAVLLGRFGMRELVLGHDHGFGRNRAGDVELMRTLGQDAGFGVDVVPPVRDDGQPVSSTLIRAALAHGDLRDAERWLGRPYGLRSQVERGEGRGRQIGVPTLNLSRPDTRKLLPPDGVYAVWVWWRNARYGGMMNQGPRPTFGLADPGLEVHVFDFDRDLYGETVTVEWARRLRDVQRFPSREALVAQLARDADAARAALTR
ncbi:MAG TPA: bifunctional riboflavin kinase/FAD synthetase [Gemmatimonadales bacterium]|nr:bifunctional riboflavin kinase/FAD synthetase [Gemmatimonadales bacterium]